MMNCYKLNMSVSKAPLCKCSFMCFPELLNNAEATPVLVQLPRCSWFVIQSYEILKLRYSPTNT